jgi:uncharacterized protein YdhG (YjbR/CyaY superfamily)
MSSADVTRYLKGFDAPQRSALQTVRSAITAALPAGEEVIAWGMPSIRISGVLVLSYAGFKNHNTIFPGLGAPCEGFGPEVEKYRATKGALKFAKEESFPALLIKKIIRYRIVQINESFPKKSGEFKVFYSSGRLKAEGTMKKGELHGAWKWYRIDGSLMRSGNFKNGVKTGEWATYTRESNPHKITRFSV